ncbi:unnamed protein product, partial [Closterium sp. NIES-54]
FLPGAEPTGLGLGRGRDRAGTGSGPSRVRDGVRAGTGPGRGRGRGRSGMGPRRGRGRAGTGSGPGQVRDGSGPWQVRDGVEVGAGPGRGRGRSRSGTGPRRGRGRAGIGSAPGQVRYRAEMGPGRGGVGAASGTGPGRASPESSTVHVNAITMKRAVAAGADVYTVDIAIVEEADKASDFQKLLAAGLPPQRAHDHRIELEPRAQPTVQWQFRLTQPELNELRKQLDYLLEKKFIRPSSLPFAAPIVFTPKKDGGFCMCIDYRSLNRVTVKSRYPIPRADELIDQLQTARVFSKIDLREGYHQIRVEPSDCAKIAFRTRYGSFEYTVMPFGLTNAPATFQMTMNKAFRPLLDKCVIIYLDDILVYSRDKQQHLADLEEVFTISDKHRLLTKGSKCEFFQDRLEFLGHITLEAGVEIDPKELDTVKAWHPPTNITELQSFLGFVNYVRRFVPDMACLTAPLTDLLRKGVTFTWGEKEHAAFSTLENVLCSPPILRIADPHRPFEVVTDASDIAIGAVLLQDFSNGLQPIAYNYPIHDREMLAIVHEFKVWRCYLTGADVTPKFMTYYSPRPADC